MHELTNVDYLLVIIIIIIIIILAEIDYLLVVVIIIIIIIIIIILAETFWTFSMAIVACRTLGCRPDVPKPAENEEIAQGCSGELSASVRIAHGDGGTEMLSELNNTHQVSKLSPRAPLCNARLRRSPTCRTSPQTLHRNTSLCSVQSRIGIIGGTGLDDPEILEGRTEKYVDTPFGKPSDALILGKIKNVDCVLLARHGRQHTIMPSKVNYQANIWALKEEGCTHVIVTTACGSLREEIQPGDIVIIDQFIDRTTMRPQTFYDGSHSCARGVCHIPMAEPFCPKTREVLTETAKKLGLRYHSKGTMLTIEGPRFSSRAESIMFRTWGADVINMTTVPEVVLAKEAGLCYASIAMATDYDCWKEHEEVVSVDRVLKTLKENANKAKSLLLTTIPQIGSMEWSETLHNLKNMAQFSVLLPRH
ncbi:PREDICTED: S-methyl-5'-thioadenosine phosphorylase [Myotis brandtii]|nr:PREDICTED: S-methyl-5'-thioadenosine phosphorylase [Myotis brandtii]